MEEDYKDEQDFDDPEANGFEDVEYEEPDKMLVPVKAMATEIINPDIIKKNIAAQDEILTALVDFVNSKLIPGQDYFSVKKGQLPSLGKGGAEKINFIFRLVPRYRILRKTWREGEVTYELQCDLYSKVTGEFSGSGVGACTSLEDKWCYTWVYENNIPEGYSAAALDWKEFTSQKGAKYKKYKIPIDNHFNIANNMLKMAKKRAYVDATLSATMASFLFTQDIEERMDEYLITGKTKPTTTVEKPEGKPPAKPPVVRKTKADAAKTVEKDAGKKKDEKQYATQPLDPREFVIPNTKSKFYGKTLVECPSWYLEGQIEWIGEGKFDPSKYGYDPTEYVQMYIKALEIKQAEKEGEEDANDQ